MLCVREKGRVVRSYKRMVFKGHTTKTHSWENQETVATTSVSEMQIFGSNDRALEVGMCGDTFIGGGSGLMDGGIVEGMTLGTGGCGSMLKMEKRGLLFGLRTLKST